MDELEKKLPDDFWRRTFDEATETPPPHVWDSIERRLDESQGLKIIPLWGNGLAASRPFMWGTGVAAAVALLLAGWWLLRTPAVDEPFALTHQDSVLSVQAASPLAAATSLTHKPLPNPSPGIASIQKGTNRQAGIVAEAGLKLTTTMKHNRSPELFTSLDQLPAVGTSAVLPVSGQVSLAYARQPEFGIYPSNIDQAMVFQNLTGKSIQVRKFGQIQRIVWFRPAEPAMQSEAVQPKRKNRDIWASVSVMPGSFNPMVSIVSGAVMSSSSTFKGVASATVDQQSVSSQANFSVAYQAAAGVQLTDRWSLESGIGYLAGRSTVTTPVSLPANTLLAQGDRAAKSLYVDALRNSMSSGTMTNMNQANIANPATGAPLTGYSSATSQTLNNDYQYVQMPVQIGYQLRPRKRLSLALLGGIITNIFVRNTVSNELVVTAKDGVYRPVSLAASLGARFRYQPSGQWSASLAGSYQPSLSSVTQASAQVQSHPTTAGMTFGVDYHF